MQQSVTGERGGALVLVALTLVPLIALFALGVDSFMMTASHLEQENNAEYAALAALHEGIDPVSGLVIFGRESSMARRAEDVAGRNHYLGNKGAKQVYRGEVANQTAGTMKIGFYQKEQRRFYSSGRCQSTGELTQNAVQLHLITLSSHLSRQSSQVLPIFRGLFGVSEVRLKSQAIAYQDNDRNMFAIAPQDTKSLDRDLLDLNGDGVRNMLDRAVLDAVIENEIGRPGLTRLAVGQRKCFDLTDDGFIDRGDMLAWDRVMQNIVD